MLTILLWTMGIALGIYLLIASLFVGLLMLCLIEDHSSWSKIKELLPWMFLWPYWVPRAAWYLRDNDLMRGL